MNTSDEAVEAAAAAFYGPALAQDGSGRRFAMDQMRAALAAAMPHMVSEAKAAAIEEAAAEVAFWNKAGADDDITQQEIINWLRARADKIRAVK